MFSRAQPRSQNLPTMSRTFLGRAAQESRPLLAAVGPAAAERRTPRQRFRLVLLLTVEVRSGGRAEKVVHRKAQIGERRGREFITALAAELDAIAFG